MTHSFDLIVKGGTVVNHDGIGVRDIGVRRRPDRRRSATCRRPRRRDDRCRGPARAAGRDRHPGALPRAGAGAQGGPGDRQPRRGAGRRHGRVRDAQHQAADDLGRDARRQGGAARATACSATSPSTSAARARTSTSIPALERLEASAGIKVFMGASTGDLLVEDEAIARPHHRQDQPPRRLPLRGRGPAARRARICARHGDPSSHPVWRDEEAALIGHPAPGAARREARQARARAARLDRRGDGVPRRPQGLGQRRGHAASPDAGRARLLRAPRHLRADEPAGARRAPSRRRSGRRSPTASSTCSAPTTPRTRARRRTTPIPRATPA